jgi:hypothetical protein
MKLERLAHVLGGALALFQIRQPFRERRFRSPAAGDLDLRRVVEIVDGLGAKHGHGMRQQNVEQRLGGKLSAIELGHAKGCAFAIEAGHPAFLRSKQTLDPLRLPEHPGHFAGHAQGAPAVGQCHRRQRVQLIEYPLKE